MNAIPDASALTTWRKSSYSGSDNGACVEVADGATGTVPVRDSKNPQGPAVVFEWAAWSSFVTAVQRDEFGSA